MADRTISTRLTLDGEAEYTAAVKNINSSVAELKSQMSLLDSQYEGQKNSTAYLTEKGAILARQYTELGEKVGVYKSAVTEATAVKDKFGAEAAELNESLAVNKQTLEQLRNSTGDTAEEEARLTAEIARQEAALAAANEGFAKAENTVRQYQTRANTAERDQNKLNTEIQRNKVYLDEASASSDGYAKSIDGTGQAAGRAGEGIGALSQAFAAAGLAKGAKEIAETLKEAVDASVEFESAITGVFKTVEGTPEQLAAISDGIKQLSTEIPLTTTELAGIAEAAGQLGIATDDVLDFTRVMAALGVSTNLSSEQAAMSLAKFANITRMSSDDFERLGSTVVALGNNFATTEADIVNLGANLAASGALVGISEANIMGLAAAMSSLGVEAQAGGTAMSKMMRSFEIMTATGADELESFAAVAGMTAAEFTEKWGDDAVGATAAFIEGLGGIQDEGGSVAAMLADLNVTESRQADMLLRLAGSGGKLTEALTMSNAAWEENAALMNEAEKFYGTTESKLVLLDNAANNLKIAIGDVLTPALGNLAESGADAFRWAEKFISDNPGVVQAVTVLVAVLGALAGAAAGIAVLDVAIKALSGTILASPAGLFALTVVGVAAAVAALAAVMPDANAGIRDLTAATEEAIASSAPLEELTRLLAEAEAMLAEKTEELGMSKEEATEKANALWEAMENGTRVLTDEEMRFIGLVDNVNRLTGSKEKLETQIDTLEEATRGYNDTLTDTERATVIAENAFESIIAEMETLQAAYDEVYQAAYDNITGQFPLFEKLDTAAKGSATNQIAIWESNTKAIENWATNLDKLVSYGVDESLVAKFREGGLDLAPELAGIVNQLDWAGAGSEGLANRLNTAFTEYFAAQEKVASGVAADIAKDKTDFDSKMAEYERRVLEAVANFDQSEGAIQAATDTVQGFINTMDAKTGEVWAGGVKIGEAVIAGIREGAETHSPSVAAARVAADVALGFTNELERQEGSAASAAAQYARAALEGFSGEFKDYKGALDFAYGVGAINAEELQARLTEALTSFSLTESEFNGVIQQLVKLENDALKEYEKTLKDAEKAAEKAEKDAIKACNDAYKEERDLLDYHHKTGSMSEEAYYAELKRLRDAYFDEGTAEWRRYNLELYNVQQGAIRDAEKLAAQRLKAAEADAKAETKARADEAKARQDQLKAEQDALKSALKAEDDALKSALKSIEDQWKDWLKTRKEQIKDELAAEKSRINNIVAGINEEVQARRNLRQDESAEDKIAEAEQKVADAERVLERARAEYDYARDDNARIEAEKLIIQKERELESAREGVEKAKQDYEDQLWYREKQVEIERVKEGVAVAEARAQEKERQAQQEYEKNLAAEVEAANAASRETKAQVIAASQNRGGSSSSGGGGVSSGSGGSPITALQPGTTHSQEFWDIIPEEQRWLFPELAQSVEAAQNIINNTVTLTIEHHGNDLTPGQVNGIVENALERLSAGG